MRVEIHEFSTGIQAEQTADGWVSRGFTGEYMNRTLNAIPSAVQNAIRNREFAVAEGTSSTDPAIIGRVVWDSDRPQSVLAVVTRGRDDRGRSASMYRYFLCEGSDRIGYILAWMRQQGGTPVFDPFDRQTIGQPHFFDGNPMAAINLRPELQGMLAGGQPAIVPHTQACTPAILNQMAETLDGLTAWAYKVEALEQPRAFQVIQPASQRAEDLLRRTVASLPAVPVPVAGGRSEQDIKSAVKGLMAGRVKVEHLQTLEAAFGDDRFDASYWKGIFDGQGASKARGFYSEQMVRLLTLRAIAVPQTLPEFLSWMGGEGDKSDRCQTSDDFQNQVLDGVRQLPQRGPNLTAKVMLGTRSIIPVLCDRPELVEPTVWLLQKRGLWATVYINAVQQEIDNDLKLMSRYARGQQGLIFKLSQDPGWAQVLRQLTVYWQDPNYPPSERYQPLADLFSELNSAEIAAFFSRVGYGYASGEIFKALPYAKNNWYTQVYDLNVQKEIGFLEKAGIITHKSGRTIMPLFYAVLFALLMSFLSFFLGIGYASWGDRETDTSTKVVTDSGTEPTEGTVPDPTSLPEGEPTTGGSSSPPPQGTETTATTDNQKSINQIVQDGENFWKLFPEDIESAIGYVLGTDKPVTKLNNTDLEDLVSIYQQNKGIQQPDGIISLPKNTSQPDRGPLSTYWLLKCDVADRLISMQVLNSPPPEYCNRPQSNPPPPDTPQPVVDPPSSEPPPGIGEG